MFSCKLCEIFRKSYFKKQVRYLLLKIPHTSWKVSKYGVFSGLYFPVFGLNTEIYRVNLRIQFEYGKIRTRKNSVFEHFSHSGLNHYFAIKNISALYFVQDLAYVNNYASWLQKLKTKHLGLVHFLTLNIKNYALFHLLVQFNISQNIRCICIPWE